MAAPAHARRPARSDQPPRPARAGTYSVRPGTSLKLKNRILQIRQHLFVRLPLGGAPLETRAEPEVSVRVLLDDDGQPIGGHGSAPTLTSSAPFAASSASSAVSTLKAKVPECPEEGTLKSPKRMIGVSQPAIAKLESGRARNVELKTLVRYAAALGGRLKVDVVREPRGRWRAPRRQKRAR